MYVSNIQREAGSHAPGLDLRIVLDFDGVLFNSAFEAFSVCNRTTEGDERYRSIDFQEFLAFRSFVTDAWQYRRLYDTAAPEIRFEQLPHTQPDAGDWDFAKRFFMTRQHMMSDPEWPKVMAPYDFFFLLKPLLTARPQSFHILSTRDVASITRTLNFFGVNEVAVSGQENIREAGSKVAVAESLGWLDDHRFLVVYVDDMNRHLEPFEGKVHLPLHANWGYDQSGDRSLGQHQVLSIIQSMLKLAGNDSAKI